MAKDRIRHARRREPERAGVSLFELVRWAIEQLGDGFADAEKLRRWYDEHD